MRIYIGILQRCGPQGMDSTAIFLHNSNMMKAVRPAPIRSFNLYGESRDMPDLVHCEPVAARSKLHNWELAPHAHARLHQFLFISKGGGRAALDGEHFPLSSGRFVNVPPGCAHAFSFQPGTDGVVVTIAAEVFDETLRAGEGLRPHLARPLAMRAPPGSGALMRELLQEHDARRFARAHVLRALCAQLAGMAARAIEASGGEQPGESGAVLLRRFEALVDGKFRGHWNVARYAAELAVAPGHLSRVCRAGTGASASRLIEARLVREARRLLAFTGLGIAQIAFELGFEDPAYFTRVFVRATGVSPRSFRSHLAAHV